MKTLPDKSFTLLELIISIILLSMIVLALGRIDTFSHFHVLTADRRSRLQNDVSVALEHISKQVVRAIGDINNPPLNFAPIAGRPAFRVRVDDNPANGRLDATDGRLAYQWTSIFGTPAQRYRIVYYPIYTSPGSPNEIIASNIVSFTATAPAINQLQVSIAACWDPTTASIIVNPNGTADNPCVQMRTLITMPSVSTN